MWFSIRFSPFSCTVIHCRNCKRLRELEEISRGTVNIMEENSKDFGLDFIQELGLGNVSMLSNLS